MGDLRVDGVSFTKVATGAKNTKEEAVLRKKNLATHHWGTLVNLLVQKENRKQIVLCFSKWREVVSNRRLRRRKQITADLFRRFTLFRVCFDSWHQYITHIRSKRRGLIALKVHWFVSSRRNVLCIQAAFRVWHQKILERKHEEKMQVMAGRFRWRVLCIRTLDAWRRLTEVSLEARKQERIAWGFWKANKLRGFFSAWNLVVDSEQKHREVLLETHRFTVQRRHLQQWREVILDGARCALAEQHWRKRALRHALCDVMGVWAANRKLTHYKYEKADVHFKRMEAKRGVRRWARWTAQVAAHRAQCELRAENVRKVKARQAVKRWRDWTTTRKVLRFQELRCEIHWESRQMSSALSWWGTWRTLSSTNRLLCELADHHRAHVLKRRCWSAFVCRVLHARERSAQLATALVHWSRKLMRKALKFWYLGAQRQANERMFAEQALSGRVRLAGRFWKRWAAKQRQLRRSVGAGGGGFKFRQHRPLPRIGPWLEEKPSYLVDRPPMRDETNVDRWRAMGSAKPRGGRNAAGFRWPSSELGTGGWAQAEASPPHHPAAFPPPQKPERTSDCLRHCDEMYSRRMNSRMAMAERDRHFRETSPTGYGCQQLPQEETNTCSFSPSEATFPVPDLRSSSRRSRCGEDEAREEEVFEDSERMNPEVWVNRIESCKDDVDEFKETLSELMALRRENAERTVQKRKLCSLIEVLEAGPGNMVGSSAILSKLSSLEREMKAFHDLMTVVRPEIQRVLSILNRVN